MKMGNYFKISLQSCLTLLAFMCINSTTLVFSANNHDKVTQVRDNLLQVNDSILQIIASTEDKDMKVDRLLVVAKNFSKIGNDSISLTYCEKAAELSKTLNYLDGKINALYLIARAHRKMGDYDQAIINLKQHEQLTNRPDYIFEHCKGLYYLGVNYNRLGKTNIALNYLNQAFNKLAQQNNSALNYAIYNEKAVAFKNIASYDSAIIYYDKALILSEKTPQKLSTIYNNIGKLYTLKEEQLAENKRDFKEAKSYLYKSLESLNKYPNLPAEALANTLLGNIANKEGIYDTALMYYSAADHIYKKRKDQNGQFDILLNKGEILRKQSELDAALKLYDSALNYYEKENIAVGIITAKINMAKVMKDKSRYKDAISLLEESLSLSIRSGRMKKSMDIYEQLSGTYEKMGNYKKAIDYRDKYIEYYQDSIFTLEKEKVQLDYEAKYRVKEFEAESFQIKTKLLESDLKLEKSRNDNTIILLVGMGLVSLLLFIYLYQRKVSRKNKIIADQKIKQLEEEKKLLAARALVEGQDQERKRIAKELHDGLGVLLSTAKMQFTSIKDKSPENQPLIEKATKMLEQAAGDVRKISHNMMPGLLTRYGFYEAVEDLFEKLDDTPGLEAKTAISGEQNRLAENTEIMLYRIVQEMVNNTLKHAAASEISLDIVVLPHQLTIDYSDNGKGFDIAKTLAKKTIGLTSIQSRVNFLNGTLDVQSKKGQGTNYQIIIPIEPKPNEENL